MIIRGLFVVALSIGMQTAPGLAAGGDDDDTPPTPTQTTTTCKDGQIWDAKSKACVDSDSSALDDDIRYRAAREFAYAGRYDDATGALAAMHEGESDRVLTYRGFLARHTGRPEAAKGFYDAALKANPNNLLTRAYLGMGLLQQGERAAAKAQLAEIRARGGSGSWPEAALDRALTAGVFLDY